MNCQATGPGRVRELRRGGYALLLIAAVAVTQIAQDRTIPSLAQTERVIDDATAVPGVPTVAVPGPASGAVPTVTLPHHRHKAKRRGTHHSPVTRYWITAHLTSYCPGSAGWVSASGAPVFYGMLANDYYPFGTRIWIPVLHLTGVVEDRFGAFNPPNYFDVWSPVCYSTPTGWFRVAVLR